MGEILGAVAKGINQGINKSPFPNPVGNTISGIKKMATFKPKKNKFEKKKAVVDKPNKAGLTSFKKGLGKGVSVPAQSKKKPAFSPQIGFAGMVNYKPAAPIAPKAKITKKLAKMGFGE